MNELELTINKLKTAKDSTYSSTLPPRGVMLSPYEAEIILDRIQKLSKDNKIPARAGRYLVLNPGGDYETPWFNGTDWKDIGYKPTIWLHIPNDTLEDTRWEK